MSLILPNCLEHFITPLDNTSITSNQNNTTTAHHNNTTITTINVNNTNISHHYNAYITNTQHGKNLNVFLTTFLESLVSLLRSVEKTKNPPLTNCLKFLSLHKSLFPTSILSILSTLSLLSNNSIGKLNTVAKPSQSTSNSFLNNSSGFSYNTSPGSSQLTQNLLYTKSPPKLNAISSHSNKLFHNIAVLHKTFFSTLTLSSPNLSGIRKNQFLSMSIKSILTLLLGNSQETLYTAFSSLSAQSTSNPFLENSLDSSNNIFFGSDQPTQNPTHSNSLPQSSQAKSLPKLSTTFSHLNKSLNIISSSHNTNSVILTASSTDQISSEMYQSTYNSIITKPNFRKNFIKKTTINLSKNSNNIKFMTLNCRSIRKKTSELKAILIDSKIDIVLLQETWLSTGDSSIHMEFKEIGYKVSKLERISKKGGGLATLINSSKCSKIQNHYQYKYDSFENLVCCVTIGKVKLLVANLYRSPSLSKSDFITQFEEYVNKLLEHDKLLFLFGDFNIDMSQKDNYTKKFINILKINGLTQIIDYPTRENSILDLIITQTHSLTNLQKVSPITHFPSDHLPLFITLKLNNKQTYIKPVTKTFRDYSSINYDEFRSLITNSILSNLNFIENLNGSESVELYNNEIKRIMDVICPIKTKTFRRPKYLKWYNSSLQSLKQKKRSAERLLRKHPKDLRYKDEYKKARNNYTNGIKQTRTNFFSTKIQSHGKDSKKLYEVLNEVTGNKKDVVLPSEDAGEKTANSMAEFYIQKVEKIKEKIEKDRKPYIFRNFYVDSITSTQTLSCFKEIGMEQLIIIISNLKKKFCCIDPAPSSVLIEVIDLLYPIILQIVNCTITESKFPDALKHAIVSPVIKGSNLDSNVFQNYRPVSSLPFLSKILEKFIHLQLVEHINDNNLYAKYQSAYRKNHSCETALTKLISDINI